MEEVVGNIMAILDVTANLDFTGQFASTKINVKLINHAKLVSVFPLVPSILANVRQAIMERIVIEKIFATLKILAKTMVNAPVKLLPTRVNVKTDILDQNANTLIVVIPIPARIMEDVRDCITITNAIADMAIVVKIASISLEFAT